MGQKLRTSPEIRGVVTAKCDGELSETVARGAGHQVQLRGDLAALNNRLEVNRRNAVGRYSSIIPTGGNISYPDPVQTEVEFAACGRYKRTLQTSGRRDSRQSLFFTWKLHDCDSIRVRGNWLLERHRPSRCPRAGIRRATPSWCMHAAIRLAPKRPRRSFASVAPRLTCWLLTCPIRARTHRLLTRPGIGGACGHLGQQRGSRRADRAGGQLVVRAETCRALASRRRGDDALSREAGSADARTRPRHDHQRRLGPGRARHGWRQRRTVRRHEGCRDGLHQEPGRLARRRRCV